MANGDYQAGLGAGFAQARAVRADADNAIGDWAGFANKLQGKLLNESVEREVSIEYVRQLRAALKEINPHHPLLKDEVASKLFEQTRISAFAKQGYQFNPSTGQFYKRK